MPSVLIYANLSRKEIALMMPTDAKITQYEDGQFLIYIIELPTMFEAWIGHKALGVSELVFEVQKVTHGLPYMTTELFLNMVKANLPGYKEDFVEEFLPGYHGFLRI